MMLKLIVFDMDGTICDSWPSMMYCYKETMKEWGYTDIPDEEFWSYFVGHLPENLKMMLHTDDEEEIDRAVRFFRKKYEEKGHSLSSPFEHVLDQIRQVKAHGYRVGLATMTLERYAIDTLKELNIDDCFDVMKGSMEDSKRSKADMIRMCMESVGAAPEETLMIGDGFNDLEAAKKTGAHFLAASYGFGITKENCEEYGIRYVDSPAGILEAVINYPL